MAFWLMVVFFAVIGSLRGWAKELLVSCSLVLAMFVNMLLDKYAAGLLSNLAAPELFLVRAGVWTGNPLRWMRGPKVRLPLGDLATRRPRDPASSPPRAILITDD